MSHDGSILIPNCACGDRMTVSNVCDMFVCMNCDGVQAREVGTFAYGRVASGQDKLFDAEMKRREAQWYPDQPKRDKE
jgi:hypothetical protein